MVFAATVLFSCSHEEWNLPVCTVRVLQRGERGGPRQCKSLPACHLAPAGVMLGHIGKWGGWVDKDFNRILKRVMVAFMCVIVTYPKVTAPKRHHPSPACLPHASFCLTDLLKLCLFVCSQSHFHLWSSWACVPIACGAVLHRDRPTGLVSLLWNCSPTIKPVILDITLVLLHLFFTAKKVQACFVCGDSWLQPQCAWYFSFYKWCPAVNWL